MTVIRHLSSITLSDMVAVWNRIQRVTYSEAFTVAFTGQMAILINEKSASIEDMERLLLEDLERGRRTLYPYGSGLSLWRGFRVMKAVRLLCKRVVGFQSASPRITHSLMHLLSAYSNHARHDINRSNKPPDSTFNHRNWIMLLKCWILLWTRDYKQCRQLLKGSMGGGSLL
ncbi:hypothetical protein DFJ73DRAFT_560561 [Zopfochytrium polystomum]|nr:hypothetical protein DFJ73DRAFT_560561 [Zopfochytrium polystomum]